MSRRSADSALGALAKRFAEQDKLRDDSVVLSIFQGVVGGLGGVDELGKMLLADFREVRGQTGKDRKERLLLEYHKLFKAWAETYEAAVQSHASMQNLSEDDLKAILSELAVSLLQEDSEFREAALLEVGNQGREQVSEMISMLQSLQDGTVAAPQQALRQLSTMTAPSVSEEVDIGAEDYDPDADDVEEQTEAEVSQESLQELLEL